MKIFTKKEEQVLLAIYHLGDEAYLIPIREEIKKYTGKYFSVGTIYAPLNRLDKYGYLESNIEKHASAAGGKPIKYYRLTERGLNAMAELKRQNELMWKGVQPEAQED
ncbi:PadR family transcriptional regulator [Acidobacteriota bacterium]